MKRSILYFLLVAGYLFTLPLIAGTINGVVSTSNGVAVEGAQISAYGHNNDSTVFTAVSDASGNYTLENVVNGTYFLYCSKQGFKTSHKGPIEIADETTAVAVNFSLQTNTSPYGSVAGTVSKSSGDPLSGVSVSLTSSNGARYNAYSSQSGAYTFNHIHSGAYILKSQKWGYVSYVHADTILVENGSQLTDVNFSMEEITGDASLSGMVINSVTSAPVEGATVTVFGHHNPGTIDSGYSAVTGADGAYSISGIFPGEYFVTCEANGYEDEMEYDVEIEVAETLDFEITPIQQGTITGTVTFDGTGLPVANAYVDFFQAENDSNGGGHQHHRFFYAMTDSNGNYSVSVTPGDYYSVCWAKVNTQVPWYYEFYDNVRAIADATVLTIADGQTIENISYGIPQPQEISITVKGKVTDDQNVALEGAKVRVLTNRGHGHCGGRNDSTMSAVTDTEGNYQITFTRYNTTETHFKVSAKKEDYRVEFYNEKVSLYEADDIAVTTDTTLENINFTLSLWGAPTNNSISGNVVNVAGEPMSGVYVAAFSRHNGVTFGITDSTGNYSLPNLLSTNYYVFFHTEGYVPEYYDNVYTWENATQVMASGAIAGINAILDTTISDSTGGGLVTGVVRDAANNTVGDVLVTIKNQFGTVVGYAMSSTNGSYSIEGLVAGTYTIAGSKIGYASMTSSLTYDPTQSNTIVQNVSLGLPVLGVGNETSTLPVKTALIGNYPNPFNPTTTLSFDLQTSATISLSVFDILGNEVATLLSNEYVEAGSHRVTFDASGFTSGMYFYRLVTPSFSETKKMVLMK